MTRLLLLLLLWLLRWEAGSSSCPVESFQCHKGGRVPLCLGQERQISCQDDTDGCQQLGSICRNHTCRCGHSSGPCLPFERFCDKRPDCPDGSDEAESLCASSLGPLKEDDCESDEFRCYPGAECYPLSFKCDGHPDCEDGGDEEGCGADLLPEAPQITPTGTSTPPEALALDPLTITAIVALLITVVVVAAVTLWASRKGKPLLSPKAAFKQLVLVEHP
ncbi:CD320 antigen [Crotalus tigris]|uniref:CD320 antigen n=1 Tax=Crotalus tigris TaxID=88082 RepID=UPI00192F60E8|nr:CD320 antigen [Crotalus tigris]XP_039180343.1 CD320 antigen [Crotalus tigris]